VLVDPARQRNFKAYAGCALLKPNRAEAASASGIEITDADSMKAAAQKLMRITKAKHLIITQGGDGMTIFGKSAEPIHVAGLSRPVFDITGAGDTVLSLLGYVLAGGGTIEEAAEIANVAGRRRRNNRGSRRDRERSGRPCRRKDRGRARDKSGNNSGTAWLLSHRIA